MQDKVINPFISTLKIPYREILAEDITTGETETLREIEVEKFIRVYSAKEKREFIFTLTIYARDLLTAIQYFTHPDYPYFILTYDKLKELVKDNTYGKRRYDDTIRELIRNSVIDYKDKAKNQFWYNPNYFAPSNRLKIYPENKYRTNIRAIPINNI